MTKPILTGYPPSQLNQLAQTTGQYWGGSVDPTSPYTFGLPNQAPYQPTTQISQVTYGNQTVPLYQGAGGLTMYDANDLATIVQPYLSKKFKEESRTNRIRNMGGILGLGLGLGALGVGATSGAAFGFEGASAAAGTTGAGAAGAGLSEVSVPAAATYMTVPGTAATAGSIGPPAALAGGAVASAASGGIGETIKGAVTNQVTGENTNRPAWVDALLSLGGSALQVDAANSAANASTEATQMGIDYLEKVRQDELARQEPFYQASLKAKDKLLAMAGIEGEYNIETDPSYQWRYNEGMRAVNTTAAARYGGLGRGLLTGLMEQGQGMASQEYQNIYNRVAGIAGLTPMASSGVSSPGGAGANLFQSAGDTRASAYAARANIYSNLFNTFAEGVFNRNAG